jgi:hypothetical protein
MNKISIEHCWIITCPLYFMFRAKAEEQRKARQRKNFTNAILRLDELAPTTAVSDPICLAFLFRFDCRHSYFPHKDIVPIAIEGQRTIQNKLKGFQSRKHTRINY